MKKKGKHSKKRKICIFKIIAILLLIMSIFVSVAIYRLNILPNRYYLILVGGLFFINIFFDFFLIRKKAKKGLRILFSFFSIILMFVMGWGTYHAMNTLEFLDKIKDTEFKIENYSVVVKSDSEYNKVQDIKDLDVGCYSISAGYKKANKKLLDEVDVTFSKYTDATDLGNDLIDDKVNAILVEDSVYAMIKEQNNEVALNTKVIYNFSIKIKSKTSAKEVNVTSEAFNIYLSGIDTFGQISSVSRSDVNMVVTVNPTTKQILLTSIPRDYYVKLHGINGSKDKLTHAGMYGIDMSINTIEDLLDIKINYYVKVNFTSVIDIVNALGGVTVDSDYAFTSIDNFKYQKGLNNLNGEEALSFARERKAFSTGDRQRVIDQQKVLQAMIQKACSKSIITKYSSLLDSVESKFQTNMSSKKITSLIKMQLNEMSSWTISSYSLEGKDSHGYTYSGGNVELYVMLPVDGSVTKGTKLINDVMSGKKLKGETYTYSGDMTSSTKVNTTNTIKKEPEENKEERKEEKEEVDTVSKRIEIQPTISCPSGYTLSNDKSICTSSVSKKTTFTCPKGYQEGENECYTEVAATVEIPKNCEDETLCPSTYTCEKGTLNENRCVISIPLEEGCEEGYKLEDDKCILTLKEDIVYVCPKGYDLEGKICVK